MKSNFVFFGKTVPAYAFFGIVGILLGLLYLLWQSHKRKQSFDDCVYIYIWSLLSAMLGAKLFYLLLELPHIIAYLNAGMKPLPLLLTYLSGGFVFYGGLFGAFLGFFLSVRYFKLDFSKQLSSMLPVLPLIHAFGRIGCYFTGCCHGVQTNGCFYVIYTESSCAPNGVPLLPIQLIEAVINFLLFLLLHFLAQRKSPHVFLLDFYLLIYSTARFVLEFFRGDVVRGSLLWFSTSQWISLFLFAAAILHLLGRRLHKTEDTFIN